MLLGSLENLLKCVDQVEEDRIKEVIRIDIGEDVVPTSSIILICLLRSALCTDFWLNLWT